MKGDCKVQSLALEIITPLNECTGRLSRGLHTAQTQQAWYAKKIGEKSRECHNHKPQPFPDPNVTAEIIIKHKEDVQEEQQSQNVVYQLHHEGE